MSTPTINPVTIPNGAAALVGLAELERRERRAWSLWLLASGRLREMGADDPDFDDERVYERARYLLWAAAWEAQSRQRRALRSITQA